MGKKEQLNNVKRKRRTCFFSLRSVGTDALKYRNEWIATCEMRIYEIWIMRQFYCQACEATEWIWNMVSKKDGKRGKYAIHEMTQMHVVCTFRLRCASSYRKGMMLNSRLSLLDTGLTFCDASFRLCVCVFVCACVCVCMSAGQAGVIRTKEEI